MASFDRNAFSMSSDVDISKLVAVSVHSSKTPTGLNCRLAGVLSCNGPVLQRIFLLTRLSLIRLLDFAGVTKDVERRVLSNGVVLFC